MHHDTEPGVTTVGPWVQADVLPWSQLTEMSNPAMAPTNSAKALRCVSSVICQSLTRFSCLQVTPWMARTLRAAPSALRITIRCLSVASRRPSSGCNGRSSPRASSRVRPPLIRNADKLRHGVGSNVAPVRHDGGQDDANIFGNPLLPLDGRHEVLGKADLVVDLNEQIRELDLTHVVGEPLPEVIQFSL
jgi:hypothetical protein